MADKIDCEGEQTLNVYDPRAYSLFPLSTAFLFAG